MDRMPHDKRKKMIIQTARYLFSEKGFRETSVKDIAAAANISPSLLYAYFESKADLHDAVLRSTLDDTVPSKQEMRRLGAGAGALAFCVYDAIDSNLFPDPDALEETKAFDKLLFRSIIDNTDYSKKHHDILEDHLTDDFICQCFEVAEREGDIIRLPDTPRIRMQLMVHIAGYLKLAFISDEPFYDYKMSKTQLMECAVKYCLRGIGFTEAAIQKYYDPEKLGDSVYRAHGRVAARG